jgi:hypothetical protein
MISLCIFLSIATSYQSMFEIKVTDLNYVLSFVQLAGTEEVRFDFLKKLCWIEMDRRIFVQISIQTISETH